MTGHLSDISGLDPGNSQVFQVPNLNRHLCSTGKAPRLGFPAVSGHERVRVWTCRRPRGRVGGDTGGVASHRALGSTPLLCVRASAHTRTHACTHRTLRPCGGVFRPQRLLSALHTQDREAAGPPDPAAQSPDSARPLPSPPSGLAGRLSSPTACCGVSPEADLRQECGYTQCVWRVDPGGRRTASGKDRSGLGAWVDVSQQPCCAECTLEQFA